MTSKETKRKIWDDISKKIQCRANLNAHQMLAERNDITEKDLGKIDWTDW